MQDAIVIQGIEARYTALAPLLDERMRRQWAAAEAQAYGWGGVSAVSHVIGMSPNTIIKGIAELSARRENPGSVDEPVARRRRRSQPSHPSRPGVGGSSGMVSGSGDSRRSHVAVALDLQEHGSTGSGTDAAGTPCQPANRGAIAEGGWVQPPEQSQDEGRRQPSRPQCAVRAHQRHRDAGSSDEVSR